VCERGGVGGAELKRDGEGMREAHDVCGFVWGGPSHPRAPETPDGWGHGGLIRVGGLEEGGDIHGGGRDAWGAFDEAVFSRIHQL
jgi:hypothetical protein